MKWVFLLSDICVSLFGFSFAEKCTLVFSSPAELMHVYFVLFIYLSVILINMSENWKETLLKQENSLPSLSAYQAANVCALNQIN